MTDQHLATRRRAFYVAGVVASLTSAPAPTLAQTASQITPRSFEPAPPPPQAPAVAEDVIRPAPAGADAIAVSLGAIEFAGGALDPSVASDLRARLVGRRVTVADIYAAVGEAEAAEARRGHVLLRLSLPRQSFSDGGTLRVTVTAGFIERVDTAGVPRHLRRRVEALLASLLSRHDATLAQIERKLTLAADLPGVALRSTLAPGREAGGVVLRIDATFRPVTGFASVDNTLPDRLGRETYAIGVNLNAPLGIGDLLYLRASGLPNTGSRTSFLDPTPRNRALAAGVVLPLGTDGLTLTVEATDARTVPFADDDELTVASRFRRLSYRARYPVVRRRALTLAAEASLDAQDERVSIIAPIVAPLSLDRLRIVRFAADANSYIPKGGLATARIEGSFGLDALGARSAADATDFEPLSRVGADDDLRKLTLSARLLQPIAPHVELAVEGSAQTSFGRPLVNSEQIGVASPDAISPVPAGFLRGDGGHVIRGELRGPWLAGRRSLIASVAPYAFAAQADLWLDAPTAVERRSTAVFAYGAGVRLQAQAADGSPGLSAGIEYGRATIADRQMDRMTFNVVGRF